RRRRHHAGDAPGAAREIRAPDLAGAAHIDRDRAAGGTSGRHPCLGVHRLAAAAVRHPCRRLSAAAANCLGGAALRHRRRGDRDAGLRAAVEGHIDAFLILEARPAAAGAGGDLIVRYFNKKAEALFGRPRDGVIGRPLDRALADSWLTGMAADFARAAAGGGACEDELARPGADGTAAWFRRQIVPISNGVAVTLRDVSERRRREEMLIERDALLRHGSGMAHIGHWVWDNVGDSCLFCSEE